MWKCWKFTQSLDEIIDTLKKLKDAVPADFHHQDTVKQDIVTVTIETNFRQGEAVVKEQVVTLTTNFPQGDLETKVDGTKGDVSETETESNEALSEWEEGRMVDFWLQRGCGLPRAAARSYMLQEEQGREWLALWASQTSQDSCTDRWRGFVVQPVNAAGCLHPRRLRRAGTGAFLSQVSSSVRSFHGACVCCCFFPLHTGNLIAAAVRKRRHRLQQVTRRRPSGRRSAWRAEPRNSGADRCWEGRLHSRWGGSCGRATARTDVHTAPRQCCGVLFFWIVWCRLAFYRRDTEIPTERERCGPSWDWFFRHCLGSWPLWPSPVWHLPSNDLRKLTAWAYLRVDNERPVPLCVRFLRTCPRGFLFHRVRGRRTPEVGTWAQCAMLSPLCSVHVGLSLVVIPPVASTLFSLAGGWRIRVVSRAFLAGGCTYAFEAGKTAVVTVASDQTGHWIRQAARGSCRGGLVTVDGCASFVDRFRQASSTSQTRQSRLLPFVRGVQPPSLPRRHRLQMGELTRSRMLLCAGLDFQEVCLPCEGMWRSASQPELQWLTNWLTFFVGVAVSVSGRWRPWSQCVRFSVTVQCCCPQPQTSVVKHQKRAACHHCSLSHLRVRHCVHLVGCQITPRTLCFHVLTTSPGLPDSDRPKNEFVLMSFLHRTRVCKFLTIFTHQDRRRWVESCRSPVKAQASARVDVPTATFILQWGPMSPTRVQVFVQMLGYVLVRQPTVILRE